MAKKQGKGIDIEKQILAEINKVFWQKLQQGPTENNAYDLTSMAKIFEFKQKNNHWNSTSALLKEGSSKPPQKRVSMSFIILPVKKQNKKQVRFQKT